MTARLLLDRNCVLGEGPCWDAISKKLWWIDGLAGFLFRYDPETGNNEEFDIGQPIGSVNIANGYVLLALQDGIYEFYPDNGELNEISSMEREITNNRLNDGKCDSKGRFWFGSMSMTANQEDRDFEITGSFYSMDTNGVIHKWFDGVGISNGLAWNREETKLYYIDSTTGSVWEFPYNVESGTIGERTRIINIDPSEGIPDGMTIDEEGMLWVAHFGGGKISRWNPETKDRLTEIALPVTNVTCCTFGGEKMNTLYITTASTGLTNEQLLREPLAGSLFAIEPGVRGREPNRWHREF